MKWWPMPPKFHDVAKDIWDWTEGRVFVAHKREL